MKTKLLEKVKNAMLDIIKNILSLKASWYSKQAGIQSKLFCYHMSFTKKLFFLNARKWVQLGDITSGSFWNGVTFRTGSSDVKSDLAWLNW